MQREAATGYLPRKTRSRGTSNDIDSFAHRRFQLFDTLRYVAKPTHLILHGRLTSLTVKLRRTVIDARCQITVLTNGLSRMRGDSHVRFLGDGGVAIRRCYPTCDLKLLEFLFREGIFSPDETGCSINRSLPRHADPATVRCEALGTM